METLYFADVEDLVQGAFNDCGELLSYWSPNDLFVQVEYLETLFKKIGWNIYHSNNPVLEEKLLKTVKKAGWI